MRLFNSKIPAIVADTIETLIAKELIDVLPESRDEVELDIESVLKEYLRSERAFTEEAKDLAHARGLDYSAHKKIKRQLAERARFGLYEESIGYLCNQLIETLLHTRHVDEIYGEDRDLRATIAIILRKHMDDGEKLDVEVRKRIKNLQEGTQDWEIRYQQVQERLRRMRGEE